jgi:hypothetical protein
MKKMVAAFALFLSFSTTVFAGPLDSFVGTYILQQGTSGTNNSGDLICPTPLILTLSIGALDSNMPQLPLLQVISSEQDNVRYAGTISSDGTAFSYKEVTKGGCAFLGLFCGSSTIEGSLQLSSSGLSLNHSESSSSAGVLSAGNCTYTK